MFALEMCLASQVSTLALHSQPAKGRVVLIEESQGSDGVWNCSTYSDLKIDKLLGICAHLVVEAEFVFSWLRSSENKIALSLLFTLHDYLVPGTDNLVIDIK